MTSRAARYILCPLLPLLCVAVATLWVRSHRRADVLAFFGPSATLNGVSSYRGSLMLFLSDLQFAPADGVKLQHGSAPTDEFAAIDDMLHDTRSLRMSLGGFRLARGNFAFMSPPPRYTAVTAPHWFIVGLALLPPSLWLRGTFRRRKWSRQGRCRECGYDLRSSPDRCPECGVMPQRRREVSRAVPVAALVALATALPAPAAPIESPDDLPVLKALDLKDVTFDQALDRFRDAAGVNLVVHWPAIEAAGFSRQTPVSLRLWDVPAATALDMLLLLVGGKDQPVRWFLADGAVTVTTSEDNARALTEVFDVRELIETMRRVSREQDRPMTWTEIDNELLRLVMEYVRPDDWRDSGGTVADADVQWGRLIVRNESPEALRHVEAFLARFRAELDEPPRKLEAAQTRPADQPKGSPRIYDVRDLLRAMEAGWDEGFTDEFGFGFGPKSPHKRLVHIITGTVRPETWDVNGGAEGRVQLLLGRLIVSHSPEAIGEVERLLEEMRRAFAPDRGAAEGVPATSPSAPARPAPRPAGG